MLAQKQRFIFCFLEGGYHRGFRAHEKAQSGTGKKGFYIACYHKVKFKTVMAFDD